MTRPAPALRAYPGGRRSLPRHDDAAVEHPDARPVICPDCPTLRHPLLQRLLVAAADGRCALPCVALEARQPIPTSWLHGHVAAIVRRGILVRHRTDAQGRVTAIDAAGSGCLVPLGSMGDMQGALGLEDPAATGDADRSVGYAASDSRVCLIPTAVLSTVLARDEGARAYLWLAAQTLERVERTAQARARTTADARLAALLATLSDTLWPLRPRDVIPGEILQRDLGALAALRTESVCRSLQSLAAQGAIERTEEGTRILDRALLDGL
ncbi:MAG: Crp/Fnr family transcriptional regulator [Deltaproteobacteria bacterium]|nr:Crp/Fnr family transcriptional regulator [Deltaproteobacteria bacterium]